MSKGRFQEVEELVGLTLSVRKREKKRVTDVGFREEGARRE